MKNNTSVVLIFIPNITLTYDLWPWYFYLKPSYATYQKKLNKKKTPQENRSMFDSIYLQCNLEVTVTPPPPPFFFPLFQSSFIQFSKLVLSWTSTSCPNKIVYQRPDHRTFIFCGVIIFLAFGFQLPCMTCTVENRSSLALRYKRLLFCVIVRKQIGLCKVVRFKTPWVLLRS